MIIRGQQRTTHSDSKRVSGRAKELQDKGVLAKCHVNVLQTQDHPMFKSYPEELKWLTTDDTRITWVAQTISDISSIDNQTKEEATKMVAEEKYDTDYKKF